MSEVNGKLVTCDRCDETVFLKCIGEGERDGGFTRWNKFESFPEGWERHSEVGLLCPDCNRQYKSLVNTFMTEVCEGGSNTNK